MAELEADQGSWLKPPYPSDAEPLPPRVEFGLDAAGRRFAYRPDEILLLNQGDAEIQTLLGQIWTPDQLTSLAGDLATNVAACDIPPVPLGDENDSLANVDALNEARVVRIKFTPEMLALSRFSDRTMPEIVEELSEETSSSFSPSINAVFFSAASRGLWGNPVMWSSVGGAPVMWSSVNGTPVMWSSIGGAPVMWSGGLSGDPVMWSGVDGTPVMWSGVDGSPVMWSGDLGATPVMWSGTGGAPAMWSGGGRGSCCCCDDEEFEPWVPEPDDLIFTSARAALDPGHAPRRGAPPNLPHQLGEGSCLVVVLDTGLDPDVGVTNTQEIEGLENFDEPNSNGDTFVDPAAGHGTFIAGLIRRLAPEANVKIGRVLSSFGDGSECVVGAVIRHLAANEGPGILNLSFTGYYPNDEPPPVLANAIEDIIAAGWIVVAAAGNDATCRKAFPAAMEEVIAVGALAPWGPAWFSNHGDWLDACAPGFDIVSNWYNFEGVPEDELQRTENAPANHAQGWAAWSGTSFSAPIVAAALARDVISGNWSPKNVKKLRQDRQAIVDDTTKSVEERTAELLALTPDDVADNPNAKTRALLGQARQRVIDDWRLARVPCLGTIVNDHL